MSMHYRDKIVSPQSQVRVQGTEALHNIMDNVGMERVLHLTKERFYGPYGIM